ncbi:methionine--tRNA ligase [Candidatus Saccharibacteria bacterium]|nr:methionine--tRNA ligase [Candidatus Saccharibacteria bacterium]
MKYICTAIAYLNGPPHIGHALDYLLADLWARQQLALGEKVLFQTGTDEHGQKVAQKAKDLDLTPEKLTDQNSVLFKDLLTKMNVSDHRFVRTTSPDHKRRVAEIWQKLDQAGHIYKNTYSGWYCEGCEAFYTDSEVKESDGKCPIHHRPFTKVEEENYFLRLQTFLPDIKKALLKGSEMSVADALAGDNGDYIKILPDFRAKEILNLLEKAPDVSISRPKSQVSWGIPVPGDPDQTMYVWIDALSNYITGPDLEYPDHENPKAWPADVQVIGKDILRFHAVIWPAMLLGLGLKLPKVLLAHGHVSIDGEKMSKSLGNVVSPDQIIDKYGADAFRYYFARHIPTTDDGDFTWDKFNTAYNTELANDLGNLVSRVSNMCTKYFDGLIRPEQDKITDSSQATMNDLEFSTALDQIWERIRIQNRRIDAEKPWVLAKDDASLPQLNTLLTEIVSNIIQIASEIDPFLPETSAKIRAHFTPDGIKDKAPILFPKHD